MPGVFESRINCIIDHRLWKLIRTLSYSKSNSFSGSLPQSKTDNVATATSAAFEDANYVNDDNDDAESVTVEYSLSYIDESILSADKETSFRLKNGSFKLPK